MSRFCFWSISTQSRIFRRQRRYTPFSTLRLHRDNASSLIPSIPESTNNGPRMGLVEVEGFEPSSRKNNVTFTADKSPSLVVELSGYWAAPRQLLQQTEPWSFSRDDNGHKKRWALHLLFLLDTDIATLTQVTGNQPSLRSFLGYLVGVLTRKERATRNMWVKHTNKWVKTT